MLETCSGPSPRHEYPFLNTLPNFKREVILDHHHRENPRDMKNWMMRPKGTSEEGNCYLYEKLGYKRIELVENINDKMDIVYYEKN